MSEPYQVGFIGAGGIAHNHMKLLEKVGGVEIAAASDVSQQTLDRRKEEFGIPHVYTDYRQMLRERPEVQAVSVCTPNGLHAENAIAALEAGKHVMVEKPMAMNATQGRAMIDAAKAAGKQLVVGFQWRFHPTTHMIRDYVKSGELGEILYVRVQALRRRGIPNWGVFGRKDLQGGGPMIDIGVHALEMAHFMMGAPTPKTVTGNTWTYMGDKPSDVKSMWPGWDHKSYTVEDFAAGMVRFDTGAMLNIEASFVAHIKEDVFNVNLMGTKGGANWELKELYADQNGYMMNLTPGYLPKEDYFFEKMKHFIEVCRDGRENESDGAAGLAVQKMLDGVYASAEAGREVGVGNDQ